MKHVESENAQKTVICLYPASMAICGLCGSIHKVLIWQFNTCSSKSDVYRVNLCKIPRSLIPDVCRQKANWMRLKRMLLHIWVYLSLLSKRFPGHVTVNP